MEFRRWPQLFFHFLNCLMIVVLQKLRKTQGSQSKFHELNIYIYLIYIYLLLLLLYNSSILDIEHSSYHIALGSTHTHKVI